VRPLILSPLTGGWFMLFFPPLIASDLNPETDRWLKLVRLSDPRLCFPVSSVLNFPPGVIGHGLTTNN